MERKLKCYGKSCVENNLKYDRDDLYKYAGKNYCYKHYNKKLIEKRDRNKLYAIIKKYYLVSYPSGLMMGQIKKFVEVNGYTYTGIAETIEYMASKPSISLDSSKGLGLVPYLYEEAMNVYNSSSAGAKEADFDVQNVTVNENKFKEENEVKSKKTFDFND